MQPLSSTRTKKVLVALAALQSLWLAGCFGRSGFRRTFSTDRAERGDAIGESGDRESSAGGDGVADWRDGGDGLASDGGGDRLGDASGDSNEDPPDCLLEGMVPLEAGTFDMGSPTEEVGRAGNEQLHSVTLTRDFCVAEYSVSQQEFEGLMGWRPSHYDNCGPTCPVGRVSWYDSVAYTNQLSAEHGLPPCYNLTNVTCVDSTVVGSSYMSCMNATQGGVDSATVTLSGENSIYDCRGFRLLTEAEWEYAARAGDSRATYNGELSLTHTLCEVDNAVLDPIAWFCGNASVLQPSGQLAPNAWGLYDMLGNVYDWTHDETSAYPTEAVTDPENLASANPILRGGAFSREALRARAAHRGLNRTADYRHNIGFRVARTRSR